MNAVSGKKIFLIDAMGLIFRAYCAPMERLCRPRGPPVKVIYVFANMLGRLMDECLAAGLSEASRHDAAANSPYLSVD